jgi:hypothetical protein
MRPTFKPTRRHVLRLAGTALALPFLESLMPRTARAGGIPPRLVILTTGEGTLLPRWTPPTLAGDALELSELLQPLAPHRDRINVISGISNLMPRYHSSNGHNAPGHTLLSAHLVETSSSPDGTLLEPASRTEVAQGSLCIGPSIDHYLASQLGPELPLNMAVNGTNVGENRMYYRTAPERASEPMGARAEARLIGDPVQVFDELLAGAGAPPTTLGERLRGERRRVLGHALESYASLSSRVSAADRARLEAHAARLSDLEARLAGPGAITCTDPRLVLPPGYPTAGREDLDYRARIDVMVQALACGVTRVAALHDSSYDGPPFACLEAPIDPELAALGAVPLPGGPLSDWHAQVHGDSGGPPVDNPNLIAGFTFYAAQFAYLLQRMTEIEEPDGNTLLDNSVVLWISEFGNGGSHATTSLPVVLAGSAGGRLATGRHLARAGLTTGDLFTSILRLFDVPAEGFGLAVDSDLQNGGVPGIA